MGRLRYLSRAKTLLLDSHKLAALAQLAASGVVRAELETYWQNGSEWLLLYSPGRFSSDLLSLRQRMPQLSFAQRLGVLAQTARLVAVLHTHGLVACSLASHSIWLDQKDRPSLSACPLVFSYFEQQVRLSADCPELAPELLLPLAFSRRSCQPTPSCDVWNLSLVLLEIFGHTQYFQSCSPVQKAVRLLKLVEVGDFAGLGLPATIAEEVQLLCSLSSSPSIKQIIEQSRVSQSLKSLLGSGLKLDPAHRPEVAKFVEVLESAEGLRGRPQDQDLESVNYSKTELVIRAEKEFLIKARFTKLKNVEGPFQIQLLGTKLVIEGGPTKLSGLADIVPPAEAVVRVGQSQFLRLTQSGVGVGAFGERARVSVAMFGEQVGWRSAVPQWLRLGGRGVKLELMVARTQ